MVWVQIVLILVLVLVNGLLSGSELAVVSSRRARLQGLADGSSGQARARAPTRDARVVLPRADRAIHRLDAPQPLLIPGPARGLLDRHVGVRVGVPLQLVQERGAGGGAMRGIHGESVAAP